MSEEHSAPSEWPRELGLDSQAGPAAYVTRAKADALVASVLDQAGYGASGATPTAASASADRSAAEVEPMAHTGAETAARASGASSAPQRRHRWAASSAAAIVLLACAGVGSASAAVMWYVRESRAAEQTQPVLTRPSSDAQPERRAKPRRAEKPTEQPARIELPAQVLESAKPRAVRRAPEDWLVEGNRLRAERRWRKADDAYAQALRSAPHSQTAYVARVASAAVRLEHLNDPAGALALYRAALREAPSGVLSEEVLFGIAEAQRALGNTAAEREALERLLREHPASPLAPQAESRLR